MSEGFSLFRPSKNQPRVRLCGVPAVTRGGDTEQRCPQVPRPREHLPVPVPARLSRSPALGAAPGPVQLGPGMPSGAGRAGLGPRTAAQVQGGQVWPRHPRSIRSKALLPSPGLGFPAGSGDTCLPVRGSVRLVLGMPRYQEDAEVLAPLTGLFKVVVCLSRKERNVFQVREKVENKGQTLEGDRKIAGTRQ